MAEPSGKRIEWNGMDVIPFEDGKVKRKDVYSDSVSILRQVGLLSERLGVGDAPGGMPRARTQRDGGAGREHRWPSVARGSPADWYCRALALGGAEGERE